MDNEKLRGRQLRLAALLSVLSPAAAFAGRIDWRWALAAVPVSVAAAWLLQKRMGNRPLFGGTGGRVLSVLYGGWAVVLLSVVLNNAANRLCVTNADPGDRIWILLLLALPLLWMGWGKSAAFFRAAEILCPAALVLLVGIVAFAVPRVEWRWLTLPVGDWKQSAPALAVTLSVPLFILPYIYKVEQEEKEGRWGSVVPVLAALVTAALAAAAAGVLSPLVAGQVEAPFFVASGVLGESVRGEGLISSLWLLSDLTLAALLSRMWRGKHWAAGAAAAGCLLAVTGISNYFSGWFLAAGTAALVLITLLAPRGKEGVVVTFW